jgi:hypothetical protein
MVMAATAIWWVPVTGLGLWFRVPSWQLVVAQLGCLAAAFLATMGLKFFWYRKVAFGERADLPLWQRETLQDVGYTVGRQVEHIELALRNRQEIGRLFREMQTEADSLEEAIHQLKLFGRIIQQSLADFEDGVVSSYLTRKQQAETEMVREEASAKD